MQLAIGDFNKNIQEALTFMECQASNENCYS